MSCDDSITNPAVKTPYFFPQRIGTVWVYERYDPFYSIYDTVVDSLTRVVSDSLGNFYSEVRESSYFTKGVHPFYQRIVGDSVFIFELAVPKKPDANRDKLFVLPFDSGRIWQNNWMPNFGENDTFRVVGLEEVSVPYGTFAGSAHIHRYRWWFNDYLTGDYWFVDGIGIVKKYERHFVAWTYDLISFRVPKHHSILNPH
jgi:hypothetical protein